MSMFKILLRVMTYNDVDFFNVLSNIIGELDGWNNLLFWNAIVTNPMFMVF